MHSRRALIKFILYFLPGKPAIFEYVGHLIEYDQVIVARKNLLATDLPPLASQRFIVLDVVRKPGKTISQGDHLNANFVGRFLFTPVSRASFDELKHANAYALPPGSQEQAHCCRCFTLAFALIS